MGDFDFFVCDDAGEVGYERLKMARITVVECDAKDCPKKCEIREPAPPEVFTILQVTDTMGKSLWFCSTECLLKWANSYKSPYSPELSEIPPEAIPEFEN